MSAGLFVLCCPHCASSLEVDPFGSASCPGCGNRYLTRVGLLIPLEEHAQPTASAAAMAEG